MSVDSSDSSSNNNSATSNKRGESALVWSKQEMTTAETSGAPAKLFPPLKQR